MKQLFVILAGGLIALLLCASCSSNGKANVDNSLLPVKQGNKWGYINKKGEYVINPQFDMANAFSDGLAKVSVNEKYGFIDKDGKYVINPTYSSATDFFEGKAWCVAPKGAPVLVDTDGKVISEIKEARSVSNYSDGLAIAVNDNGKYWAIDGNGNTAFELPIEYAFASNFIDGLAAVQSLNLTFGYVDKKGNIAIDCQFNSADHFMNGRAIVMSGDKYGVINKKGEFVINPQFDRMKWDDGRYIIQMGDVYGWCDEKGKIIINPQFESAVPFVGGKLAPVTMGKQCGYINKAGKIEINPQFQAATLFLDDVAWAYSGSKWGLIDKDGKYVVNPQFDEINLSDIFFLPVRETVESEYFNKDGIVSWVLSMLNDNKVDGMKVTATSISDFRKKYRLGDNAVSVEKKYSPDLKYAIFAEGTFVERVSDGWWGTTTRSLPNACPDYAALLLLLSDSSNTKPLYDALIEKFGGYNGKRSSGQYLKLKAYPGCITIYASDKPIKEVSNDELGWRNE